MVKLLVKHGCSLNDKDEYGQTPIYYAVREDRRELVKEIVRLGADIHIQDMHGQTCLFYAAKHG